MKSKRTFKISDPIILFIIFITLLIIFSIADREFIMYANISSMVRNMVITGLLGLGLTPLMIARGLDISFGSSISFTSVIVALLYTNGVNLWLTLFIGIILGTIIGFINGVLIESFNLLPIILTLGSMAILQALALVFSDGSSILMLTDELYWFATKTFIKVPITVLIFIVLVFVYWLILRYTKIGTIIYIIGANPSLANLSGIKVKKIKIILYTFMGLIAGIASIIMITLSGVGHPYHGSKLLLTALSAVILGGISLSGGSGNIWGTVLGVFIITVIFNGLTVLNVPSYYIQIYQGIALILIVSAYEIRKRRFV